MSVVGFQAAPPLLQQDPVGDVDEHDARVFAAGSGLGHH